MILLKGTKMNQDEWDEFRKTYQFELTKLVYYYAKEGMDGPYEFNVSINDEGGWYMFTTGSEKQYGLPFSLSLSPFEPDWTKFQHLKKTMVKYLEEQDKAAKKAALRKVVLEKLTKEEREALGINFV